MSMTLPRLEAVRDAVARELEARGLSNKEFIADIREGRRDDGPYMIGALAIEAQDNYSAIN